MSFSVAVYHLHQLFGFILQFFKGFVGRRSAVGGKSGQQRCDIRLRVGVSRDLRGDRDDERRQLVTRTDDEVPYLVGYIYLLALVVVKLRTDGLEQILLHLPDAPGAERLRLRLLQLKNHMLGLRALQQQCQPLVGAQTDRGDGLLTLALQLPLAFLLLIAETGVLNEPKAENQHELLFGACQSGVKLTNTQEHILMLLSQ